MMYSLTPGTWRSERSVSEPAKMLSGRAQLSEKTRRISDVRHLRHGGGRRGGGPPAHERGARASRPRRRRPGGARRGRHRLPAARDHRRRGRRAAARQRDGRRDRGVQRRDLQPPRAARRARVARAPLPHPQRRRGAAAPLRGAWARLRPRARRDVRPGAVGRAPRTARAGARPDGREAALPRHHRRRLPLRLGAEGPPRLGPRRTRAGLGSARRLPPHRLRAQPGERLRRHPEGPTRRPARAGGRECARRPLLGGGPLPRRAAAAAQLRAHLVRAVRAALVSDVPLGVFLSGGLDSTAVTAVTRSVGGELNTFALGFAERGFDERDHAALAARALGTRHHTLTISPSLFLEGVRDLTPLIDEPLADPAWVPTFLLSRFARTHVKTVLVGEGADELFAGYPTYLGGALAARYARLPAGVRRAVAAAAPALGAPLGNTTVRYLLRRFLEEADRPAPARHRAWTGCVDAARLAALATPGGPLALPPEPAALPARSAIDALLALDLTGYLTDDLLPKLDRASMAASLEGRAPFLDHHLVDFACRLPVTLKLRGLASKRVLRRAVADLVPGA